MITGAHVIIYTSDAEADRAIFRDVFALHHVDVGEGWLIFSLPPTEVAFHPSETNGAHELFLTCPNVAVLVQDLTGRGIACTPISNEGWGLLTRITLPSGSTLGIYEPRHAMP